MGDYVPPRGGGYGGTTFPHEEGVMGGLCPPTPLNPNDRQSL
jgi:hypothetical protein